MKEWIQNVKHHQNVNELKCSSIASGWNQWKITDAMEWNFPDSMKYAIDINPRLLLSADALVQALIDSGVGRYFECTTIDGTYM